MHPRLGLRVVAFACLLPFSSLVGEQAPVRYREGRVHGFVVLSDLNDRLLASGTAIQHANGNRVTNELALTFKDGSIYRETSVFSQTRTFRLLTYRLLRKGPTFKGALDMSVTTSTGQVTIHYTDDDGKTKTITERLELPADLANGMVSMLLGDIGPNAPKTTVSMLVATPKPRLVKLDISPTGEDSFTVGSYVGKATRYNVKVDIGGVTGLIAPIVGKQPPDSHVWITSGQPPGFLKSEGPLFEDGPIWRIQLAGPVWPKPSSGRKQ